MKQAKQYTANIETIFNKNVKYIYKVSKRSICSNRQQGKCM